MSLPRVSISSDNPDDGVIGPGDYVDFGDTGYLRDPLNDLGHPPLLGLEHIRLKSPRARRRAKTSPRGEVALPSLGIRRPPLVLAPWPTDLEGGHHPFGGEHVDVVVGMASKRQLLGHAPVLPTRLVPARGRHLKRR